MKRLFALWWVAFLLSLATTIAVPALSPVRDLRITQVFYDLEMLRSVLEASRAIRGRYPTQKEGLASLVGADLGALGQVKSLRKDQWGHPYVYTMSPSSAGYSLYSVGRDGIDSNGGGDDVTSPEKEYRCEDYGINCPPKPKDWVAIVALAIAVLSFLVGMGRGILALRKRWSS